GPPTEHNIQALLQSLGIQAKMLLPLFCGEQLWGLLSVSEVQETRQWKPEDVELLQQIAIQLTIAIQQASTYAHLQTELQKRQTVELELRQSQRRLEIAQRMAHVGSWELDLANDSLYWSEEVFRIFEIDSTQFGASYDAFLNLIHPGDRNNVDTAYRAHLQNRQPYSLVHRLRMADGRIKYVREFCETEFTAQGTPRISRGTIQDITVQHKTELKQIATAKALEQLNQNLETFAQTLEDRVTERTATLVEREAFLYDFLNHAHDLIQMVSLETGNFEFVNQAWQKTLGYSAAEVETLTLFDVVAPSCLPHCYEILDQMRSGTLQSIDQVPLTFISKQGQQIWLEGSINCRYSTEVNSQPHPISTRAILRNVTAQHQADQERQRLLQELQESRQFLQTVLDTMPLNVFWKDRDSRYIGANSRFLQANGLRSVAELVGKTDFDLVENPTQAEQYIAHDQTIMQSGQAAIRNIRPGTAPDGTTIWLETDKVPLQNLTGDIIGVLAVQQDITARRQSQITMQRQLATIEAAVDGIAILQNNQYQYMNSAHARLFGYESA
ncbi:MAG: PAS domain S-box protein, partial [Prochlorothrix sp.]